MDEMAGLAEAGTEDAAAEALVAAATALSQIASDLYWITRSPRHNNAAIVRSQGSRTQGALGRACSRCL